MTEERQKNPYRDRTFLSAGDEFGPDEDINFKKNRVIPMPERLVNTDTIIPSGLICMWSGTIPKIPGGWLLCDGTKGTPDLRDRFIKGASAGENAGGIGGSGKHTHANHSDLSHANHSHDSHGTLTHANHNHDTHSGNLGHSSNDIGDHDTELWGNSGGDQTVVTTKTHGVHTHANHSYSLSHSTESMASHGTLTHSPEAMASHSIGSHSSANHEPVYYAILFIMKE